MSCSNEVPFPEVPSAYRTGIFHMSLPEFVSEWNGPTDLISWGHQWPLNLKSSNHLLSFPLCQKCRSGHGTHLCPEFNIHWRRVTKRCSAASLASAHIKYHGGVFFPPAHSISFSNRYAALWIVRWNVPFFLRHFVFPLKDQQAECGCSDTGLLQTFPVRG